MHNGPRCSEAATARAAFTNAVNRPLQPEYYVLLGFPLTAAVAVAANGELSDRAAPIPWRSHSTAHAVRDA